MAATAVERFGSRRGVGGTTEYLYVVTGSDDETELVSAVLSVAPATHSGKPQKGITELDQQGNELWYATVEYTQGDNSIAEVEPEEAPQTFSFDTSGGTQHITQSLPSGTAKYPFPAAPSFRGAIGVSSDGDIAGVDIIAPVFEFSVDRSIPVASMTSAYFDTLYQLTGRYNKNNSVTVTFRDGVTKVFAAGELLFKGCRGQSKDTGTIDLTYFFAASPNKTNIAIGTITVTSKLGWQYLWVYYKDIKTTEDGKNFVVPQPFAAYVEDVYEAGNLSQLNVR